ncbi:unnamed protein product [Vicia faba]|uniref:C2 domain-containing protein n=1 Tax=Vicia faba TaxID=3906 RepID=A0AAV1ACD5_VICFA|nr:unnamed protein product [Vicia faba]
MEARDKPKTLELTVLSAQDIHVNGEPVTTNVFVVVRAESATSHTTPLSTAVNGVHSWNEKFRVELSTYARSVSFEVKYQTASGVRDIGVARIAVSDFLGGSVPETSLQVLSYGLRDWNGLRCGVVNFSVRVVLEEETESGEHVVADGVVTGIPCWWNRGSDGGSV